MKTGEILLVNANGRVLPVVLLEIRKNGFLVIQIKPHSSKAEKATILIGQPDGIRSESVVMLYRTYTIRSLDIVKSIGMLDNYTMLSEIRKAYKTYTKQQDLHRRLHNLKKKISLAQFNNIDYSKYQKELDEILSELGYNSVQVHRKEYDTFGGFRVAPSKGFIKVYRGGGGRPR